MFLDGHVRGVRALRWCPGPDPLRQLEGRGRPGVEGPRPRRSRTGSSRCVRTTGSTASSASRASRAATRRAAWRARSAGSVAAISCPSRTSRRWPSSTSCSTAATARDDQRHDRAPADHRRRALRARGASAAARCRSSRSTSPWCARTGSTARAGCRSARWLLLGPGPLRRPAGRCPGRRRDRRGARRRRRGRVARSRLARATRCLVLDHYLEVLASSPGRCCRRHRAGPSPRRGGSFTEIHERFWTQARRRLGDRDGTTRSSRCSSRTGTCPPTRSSPASHAALTLGVRRPGGRGHRSPPSTRDATRPPRWSRSASA